MVNFLCGFARPRKGQMLLDGCRVRLNPGAARRQGVSLVRRRTDIAPGLTVMEHVMLGSGHGTAGPLRRKKAIEKMERLAAEYGLELDLHARMGSVSAGARQEASVLRMLYRDSDICLFDEASAEMTPQEADRLFGCMRRLADGGRTVLFTTRKPGEALRADVCTVLRDGKTVADVTVTETTDEAALYRLMTGLDAPLIPKKKEIAPGNVVLEVRDASVCRRHHRGYAVKRVSLEVRAGEIVCVAGSRGNGLTILASALAGAAPLDEGRIRLIGENITAHSALERAREGVGYLPWRDQGLALPLSVRDNLIMKRTNDPAVQDSGWIRKRRTDDLADQWLDDQDYPAVWDGDTPVRYMTRGQRACAVLSREIDRGCRVLLAVLPTAGLNERERADVLGRILALRESRRAVLLFTTDAEEAMALGDRMLVMRGGEIVAEFHPGNAAARELGLYMTGDRRQGGEDFFDEE